MLRDYELVLNISAVYGCWVHGYIWNMLLKDGSYDVFLKITGCRLVQNFIAGLSKVYLNENFQIKCCPEWREIVY